jgi:hypothetical protein
MRREYTNGLVFAKKKKKPTTTTKFISTSPEAFK